MPGGFVLSVLLYFLFKPVKLWRAEELPESDVQPITDFLHSRDFGAFAFFTQNTIYGRFVQATSHGQCIGRQSLFRTKLRHEVFP